MRSYVIAVLFVVLAGCASSLESYRTTLSYTVNSHDESDVSYYVNQEYVGKNEKGVQAIIKHLATLPEGSTVEMKDEKGLLYVPVVSGSVLNDSRRGSSASVFDMCAIPTTSPALQELISDKKLIVVKSKESTIRGAEGGSGSESSNP